MSGGNEGYRGQAELAASDARQAREAAALAAKTPDLDELAARAWKAIAADPLATVAVNGSVLRDLLLDRTRLDWLNGRTEAVASSDGAEHIANAWGVYGQCHDVRDAIDAEIGSQASPAPENTDVF